MIEIIKQLAEWDLRMSIESGLSGNKLAIKVQFYKSSTGHLEKTCIETFNVDEQVRVIDWIKLQLKDLVW